MRRTVRVYATIVLVWVHALVPTHPFSFSAAHAAPPPPPDISFAPPREIPTRPSAPPKLGLPPKIPSYACKRQIMVGGQTIPCDSFTQRDGERLRPYLAEVPEALAHLDLYQRNRRTLEWLPYLGTAALLIALGGILTDRIGEITTSELDADGKRKRIIPAETSRIIRNLSVGAGGIILIGTFTYGFLTLTLNERNFDNAIKKYNQAKPEAPIDIKVEGTMFFDLR